MKEFMLFWEEFVRGAKRYVPKLWFLPLILAAAGLGWGQGYSNGGVTYPDITDTGGTVAVTGKFTASGATVTSGGTAEAGDITVTFPATVANASVTTPFRFTSTAPTSSIGTSSQLRAFHFDLLTGGVAGVGNGAAAIFVNNSLAYNTANFSQGTAAAIIARASGTGTGNHTAVYGSAQGASTYNVGVEGNASAATNTIGVVGTASGTNKIGVYGYMGNTGAMGLITTISAAIAGDNGANAIPILALSDNNAALPTTGATATFQVLDGAQPQNGNGVLTSATMTAETQGQIREVVSSYTWTNAQVAALAGTAGDITVATLPAKTLLRNAYVVITGAAAGPTTVTVSCGDAIGGTPFINYIVPSDAKASASTVYGDAVAERGTAIDVEFYYVPAYAATTLVTCHFISTGANLSTVTGSTGRVILETVLLP